MADRLGEPSVRTIVRRYQEGESARSLAKEFGVAPSALLNLMRERSIVVRKRGVPHELALLLAKEYRAGGTIAELGKKHGLPHGAILRSLRSESVEMRPTGRRRKI